ncbi:MAG: hypothetical protein FWE74_01645 [Oscillospiraceae bacterium]|nr:hypothetical protein [Oscillospiraceae bacterium]
MKCCLWLNGVKVWNARDIKNNFDPTSLRGYFMGGSLLRWLEANGGEEEAKKLEETGNIEYAFGMTEKPKATPPGYACGASEQGNTEIPALFPPDAGTCSAGGKFLAGGTAAGSGSSLAGGSGSASGSLGYGLYII